MRTAGEGRIPVRLEVAFLRIFSGNIFVTIANLGRDVTIAAVFGAGVAVDNFFLVISIPIFLLGAGAGAWRSIVVPELTRALSHGWEYFESIAAQLSYRTIVATFAVSALLGGLSALIMLTEPGGPGARLGRLANLALLILPMYMLAAVTELNQGALQARNRLFGPNLARAGLPVGLIVGALVLGESMGVPGVVPGGTVGALAGALVILVMLKRERMLALSSPAPLPAAINQDVNANFRALVTATAITYVSPLIGQWMATTQGVGAVSYLGYANRLTTGIIALVSAALAPVLLGFYAARIAEQGRPGLRRPYIELTRACAWAGCVITLGLWLTSDLLITLAYQRGEFTSEDATAVRLLVDCYALTFPFLLAGASANTLISALSRNQVLVPICVALVITNVIANVVLMNLLGVAGLALSSSVVYALSLVLMNRFLRAEGVVQITGKEWLTVLVPFGLLALFGLLPLSDVVRVKSVINAGDLATSILVFAIFVGMAATANRSILSTMLQSRRKGTG